MSANDTAVAAPSREATCLLGRLPMFACVPRVGRRHREGWVQHFEEPSLSRDSLAQKGIQQKSFCGSEPRASAVAISERFIEIRSATRC